MSQAVDLLPAARTSEARTMAGVCIAHLVSHYYFVLLAPLFLFVRADFGVSYTELGLALTIFSLVSLIAQTPMGFFIDRTDARLNLIAGLLLGSVAIAIAGLVNSFWVFLAMFGVMGLANTVYHPADYAILSERVAPERMTQAFSYHTCAGMIGSAIAPGTLLLMHSYVGWRGAFIGASMLGFVAALILLAQGGLRPDRAVRAIRPAGDQPASATAQGAQGWSLLLSTPILLNLTFFFLLSLASGGLNQYLVVGLAALHHTPLSIANTALTGLLAMSAVGVLLGGVIATRMSRHNVIAALGMLVTGCVSLWLAFHDPGALLLIFIVSIGGLASGITFPSRDMIVRSATPPGSFGKVFAFVTTGFHIGGIIAPLIFGQLLDHGRPQLVFIFIAACSLLAIGAIAFTSSVRRA